MCKLSLLATYMFMYFFLPVLVWPHFFCVCVFEFNYLKIPNWNHSHSVCYFVLLSGIYLCTYFHSNVSLVFCHLLFSLTVKSLPPLLHVPLVTVTSSSQRKLGVHPHNHWWLTTRCLRTDSRLCRASRHTHTHIYTHTHTCKFKGGYTHMRSSLKCIDD